MKSWHIAVAAAVGTAAAIGTARAVTDTVFRYENPRTGFYNLNVMDFNAARSVVTYEITYPVRINTSGSGGCFTAGVHLPEGAKITALTGWYNAQALSGVQLFLDRHNPLSGQSDEIASVASNDTSGGIHEMTKAVAPSPISTVHNKNFSYGVAACVNHSDTDTFYGARVTFTYVNAGD